MGAGASSTGAAKNASDARTQSARTASYNQTKEAIDEESLQAFGAEDLLAYSRVVDAGEQGQVVSEPSDSRLAFFIGMRKLKARAALAVSGAEFHPEAEARVPSSFRQKLEGVRSWAAEVEEAAFSISIPSPVSNESLGSSTASASDTSSSCLGSPRRGSPQLQLLRKAASSPSPGSRLRTQKKCAFKDVQEQARSAAVIPPSSERGDPDRWPENGLVGTPATAPTVRGEGAHSLRSFGSLYSSHSSCAPLRMAFMEPAPKKAFRNICSIDTAMFYDGNLPRVSSSKPVPVLDYPLNNLSAVGMRLRKKQLPPMSTR
eukprot:TRINITY_DN3306_c0_g1_i1.p1 TRINITY_DN3306_c0_g1~~TRINITY_DN3306_c0_g1_i1.p1  ORF type:complete len:317 (+),score=54.07 TRINITY_DN3306_c0_g1_i1:65-1015(+)